MVKTFEEFFGVYIYDLQTEYMECRFTEYGEYCSHNSLDADCPDSVNSWTENNEEFNSFCKSKYEKYKKGEY